MDVPELLKRYQPLFKAGVLLPTVFVAVCLQHLSTFGTGLVGIDARIYYRASAAWTAGGDPWAAFATQVDGGVTYHFAALPPTVVALAPFTILPEELFVWCWVLSSALIAAWTVRRLNLPGWWILFPPTVLGVVSGNPQIHLMGLLLSGRPALQALAPMLKVYAVVPLLGERRPATLALALAAVIATVAIAAPLWVSYIDKFDFIAGRLRDESEGGYSAWVRPIPLLPLAGLGLSLLAITDVRAASWLAAIAVFPSTQLHISTLALPVLARIASPWFAVGTALPFQGVPALAVAAFGIWRFTGAVRRRSRRLQVQRELGSR